MRVHPKQVAILVGIVVLFFLLGGPPSDPEPIGPGGVTTSPYLSSVDFGKVGDGGISWHRLLWCAKQGAAGECAAEAEWNKFIGLVDYHPDATDDGSGRSYQARLAEAAQGEPAEIQICTNAGIAAAVQQRLTEKFHKNPECPVFPEEMTMSFSFLTELADEYPVASTAWMIHRNVQRAWEIPCAPEIKWPKQWQYIKGASCEDLGWECLFRRYSAVIASDPPLPEECLRLADMALDLVTPKPVKRENFASDKMLDYVRRIDYRQRQLPYLGRWLLSAAHFDLVSRVSPQVENWVADHTTVVNPDEIECPPQAPVVSMHVRAGDRCVDGMHNGKPCFKLPDFREALISLQNQYGACHVLLATDSKTIVEQLNERNSPLRTWTVSLMQLNRSLFTASKTCTPMPHCQFIENRAKTLGTNMSDVGMSLAADIHLLRHGDIFLGGFDTNVGRAMYFKMFGRLGQLPAFYHFQPFEEKMLSKNPLSNDQLIIDFMGEFPDYLGGPFTGVDND